MVNFIYIFGGILIVLLLAFTIVSIVLFVKASKYVGKIGHSFEKALKNNIYCGNNPGKCLLNWNDKLPVPTITQQYSKSVAQFAADQVARVEIVNNDPGRGIHAHPDTQIVKRIIYNSDKNPLIGTVVVDKNKNAWVMFRGTQNIGEWIKDFQFQEVPQGIAKTKPNPTKNAQGLFMDVRMVSSFAHGAGLADMASTQQVLCHKGFLDIYNTIKSSVFDAVDKIKPNKVIVSGHSLGAGIATLAAIDLGARGHEVYTYVFASPRVCNANLQRAVTKYVKGFWRMTNEADIIPTFPWAVMPDLADPDKPFFYGHVGANVTFTDNRNSLEQNHSLVTYINALRDT